MPEIETPDSLDAELVAATRGWARQAKLLVAVDFDGTLAPFASDPMESRSGKVADDAIRRLAQDPGVQLALISGRSIRDLTTLAQPPVGTSLAGSHGAEHAEMTASGFGNVTVPGATPEAMQLLDVVEAELQEIVDTHPGSWIEYKPYARVLHTRNADREVAKDATARALAGPGSNREIHVLHGKEVVEIAVVQANKGEALSVLMAKHSAQGRHPLGVVFMGDDVTDEDAFAVIPPQPMGLSIKVGPEPSCALFRVADPDQVGIWLSFLAALRQV